MKLMVNEYAIIAYMEYYEWDTFASAIERFFILFAFIKTVNSHDTGKMCKNSNNMIQSE